LLGISFKNITDCRTFTATMNEKELCVRVARWALLLEEFNYTIEHRAGRSMQHVDALSRYSLQRCMVINAHRDGLARGMEKAQREDVDIKKIMDLAEARKIDGYMIKGGVLFKEINGGLRIVVSVSLRLQIIRQAHERGHFSVTKEDIFQWQKQKSC